MGMYHSREQGSKGEKRYDITGLCGNRMCLQRGSLLLQGQHKVEGSEAVHQNETCCGSFVERGEKSCGCNVKGA